MGRIRSPETSVQNQTTLRNIPEEDRIQVNRSESARSRIVSHLTTVGDKRKSGQYFYK